ncbi:sarcosine oxidase subunit delta [Microbaculum marinum]|uniref:Sarcosine oxidase subunit delta n=1 Tax=Microbaculum marinum TaxID=1764581 RepID=A0AAW9RU23_9HYPH
MHIVCPFCGERSVAEFSYEGDATVERPALDASTEDWCAAVYDRVNPRGPHAEYWQHSFGCRAWLRVERDTLTHRISGVRLAGRHAGTAGPAGQGA